MKLNNTRRIYEIFDLLASIDIKKYKRINKDKEYDNFIKSYHGFKRDKSLDSSFNKNIKNINIKKVEQFFNKEIPIITKYIVHIIDSEINSKNYTNKKLPKHAINEMYRIIATLLPEKKQKSIAKEVFLEYSNTLKKDNTYNIFYINNLSLLLWDELFNSNYDNTIAFTFVLNPISTGLLNTSMFFTKNFSNIFNSHKSIIENFSMEYFLHALTHEFFHVISYVNDDAYQTSPKIELPASEYTPKEIVKKLNIYDITEIRYMVDKKDYNPNNAADIYTTIIFIFALLLHNERLIDLGIY